MSFEKPSTLPTPEHYFNLLENSWELKRAQRIYQKLVNERQALPIEITSPSDPTALQLITSIKGPANVDAQNVLSILINAGVYTVRIHPTEDTTKPKKIEPDIISYQRNQLPGLKIIGNISEPKNQQSNTSANPVTISHVGENSLGLRQANLSPEE